MTRLRIGTDSKNNRWGKLIIKVGDRKWIANWVGDASMCAIPLVNNQWYGHDFYRMRKSIKYTCPSGVVGTISPSYPERYALDVIRSAIKEQIWKLTDPLYKEVDNDLFGDGRVYIQLKFSKTIRRGEKKWYKR